jgi:phosphatidylglycerophosphatase C
MFSGPTAPSSPKRSPLPIVSSEDVIARLEEAASTEAVIAFDADGTLWSGDIGIDTFEALLERRAVKPAALSALRREAEAHGVTTHDDPTAAARALYGAFKRGVYPESRAFQMMTWVFAGYREEEVRAFGLGVIEAVSLSARIHPEILPLVRWAPSRSIPNVVVSASCSIVVKAAIERLGLPVGQVFAMSAAVKNGVVAPHGEGHVTYGQGKVETLRAGTKGSLLLGAFGDSAYDLPMLAEARIAVAVRPKPELRARASACPGLVELAPRSP